MGDSYHQSSSRLGLRSGGGEIVEVQGGHIVRSTGRKDRHSKVCTAKGPRDRRVRLSAHTAIQFYDVQDRLGYDRPSKAVDWLIKKAKAAIDELAELPAWKPTTGSTANAAFEPQKQHENCQENSHHNQHQQRISIHHTDVLDSIAGSSSKRPLAMVGNENEVQGFHHVGGNDNHPSGNSSSFLPPSMDSDSIADTIKSFFPMGASAEANTSAMQFQSFPPPDLLSRTSSHNQDLRLSLHSFQDPLLLHHHHHSQQAHHHNTNNHSAQQQVQAQAQAQAAFFTGTTPVQLGFDGSGWSEQHQQQIQRLSSWNAGGDTCSSSGGASAAAGGGYVYNSVAGPSLLQPFFGQNQFFSSSQRGPLQSSNTPSVRAWIDPSTMAMNNNTADHSQHQHHQAMIFNYQQSISGINFASGVGGFSGFCVPSRIQGDEEEHDGISDKPSSASSDSRH